MDALSHELEEFSRTDELSGEEQMSEADQALAQSLEAGEKTPSQDGEEYGISNTAISLLEVRVTHQSVYGV